jgi:putative addiction module component (TIGR02574 family)
MWYNDAMNTTVKRLLDEALQLPETERADLAGSLIESLDPQGDEDADAAWAEEIGRRVRDLDTGVTQPVPWPIARQRILGSDRGPTES